MKRSNIIIISIVAIFLTWLLISGWLQVKAYFILKEGKVCSYARFMDSENTTQLASFKNIKIDFEKYIIPPNILIQSGKSNEISYVTSLKQAVRFNVSGDTLYLHIKNGSYNSENIVRIKVPFLNNVTLLSDPDDAMGYSSNTIYTTISGFKAITLSVMNECPYNLRIDNNKLNKLELSSKFQINGKVEILNYPDYDSLDVDIKAIKGTLIIGSKSGQAKEKPKQWISIKVPGTFRVEAEASFTNKITFKK